MRTRKEIFQDHLSETYLSGALAKLSAHELLAIIDHTKGLNKKEMSDLFDMIEEKIKIQLEEG